MFYDLRHGDSTNLFANIHDGVVDAVVTDPPYFIDGMGSGWNKSGLEQSASKGKTVRGLPVGMKFDPKQGRDFEAFMSVIAKECLRVLKPGGYFVSFSQPRLYHRMALAAETQGFEILDTLTWSRPGQAKAFSQDHFVRKKLEKNQITKPDADALLASLNGRKTPQLGSQSELIVLARKSLSAETTQLNSPTLHVDQAQWAGLPASNIIRTGAKRAGKDKANMHMTVKPVDLIAHLIRLCTPEDGIVLDPFLGSGSHGVSAVSEGRSFIGFEMVEEYFTLSQSRISTAARKHSEFAPGEIMAEKGLEALV